MSKKYSRFEMHLTKAHKGKAIGEPWWESIEEPFDSMEEAKAAGYKIVAAVNDGIPDGDDKVGYLGVRIPENQKPHDHHWVKVSEKIYRTQSTDIPYRRYQCTRCKVKGVYRLDKRAPVYLATYYKHPDYTICYKALERIQGKHKRRSKR